MENKYKMATWVFLAVQGILLMGILSIFYFSNQNNAPVIGQSILESDFVFEIEEGEQLLISKDFEFTDPILVERDSELQLEPGVYYWKIKSWRGESEVKSFTFENKITINPPGENKREIIYGDSTKSDEGKNE